MKRRDFITAAGLAGVAPLALSAMDKHPKSDREYYELRKYEMLTRAKQGPFLEFLKNAAIPAWNRLGIEPVGIFTPRYGTTTPVVYVLLPHPSPDLFLTADRDLLADAEFRQAGAEFIDAPLADPGYARMESSFMIAFDEMPKLELPKETLAKKSRIFSLRIYESHSLKAAKKKVEMFNQGGEIAIFRKTGLQPMLFGETVLGSNQPNLTYMLAFDDMDHQAKAWAEFRGDPDWLKLRADSRYADTVSNVTEIILLPASGSQI